MSNCLDQDPKQYKSRKRIKITKKLTDSYIAVRSKNRKKKESNSREKKKKKKKRAQRREKEKEKTEQAKRSELTRK